MHKSLICNNNTISWGVGKRLEFIEFRLYWESKINRADLMSVFSISVPQASADLSKYKELAPGNMVYDKKGKFYFSSPNFRPVLITPSSDQYLLRYFALAFGIIQPKKSYIGFIPPADTVPIPWRRIEPDILRKILHAIRFKKAISVEYQSLSRSEKMTRWISPHALGFDGFRWHCRSYCHIDNFFKDFTLGRIMGIIDEKDSEVDPKDDKLWATFVTVKIGPNPELAENHRKVIEYEYGMINGEASIQVRSAMLFYFLNSLGLSLKENDISQFKRHIVLLNAKEVREGMNL
jgi:hypothetical protein